MTAAASKVFGIGLNKTGTTTLGVCLTQLGYRHTSSNLQLTRCVAAGDLRPVFAHADRYESFEDWPWPLIYRELDERYPGSKFVLTTRRDAETWIRSLKNHATLTGPTEFREVAYGHPMPHGREAEHIERYERHNREVREYFRERPGSLLEVCWETGSGWKDLGEFLGREVPDLPLPHANRSTDKRGRLAWQHAKRLFSGFAARRGAA
jgi:hypothetical protein